MEGINAILAPVVLIAVGVLAVVFSKRLHEHRANGYQKIYERTKLSMFKSQAESDLRNGWFARLEYITIGIIFIAVGLFLLLKVL